MKKIFESVKIPGGLFILRQESKERFLDLMSFPCIKSLALLSGVVILATAFFSFEIVKWASQDILKLHYNVVSGIDLIGDKNNLYIYPVLGLLMLFINVAVSMIVQKERKFMSYFLMTSALTCNLVLLLSLGLIYIINFR